MTTPPNPSIDKWFGNPVIDWTQPRRDPWPQLPIFEYTPTDNDGVAYEPDINIFDTYDKAAAAWINTWLFAYDQRRNTRDDPRTVETYKTNRAVPVVFASPDRAFAQAAAKLCPDKPTKFDTPGAPKVVPLPFASLEMSGDPTLDRKRWNNRPIRYGGYNYDYTEMLQYRFPIPVSVTYSLSVWSKNKWELDGQTGDYYTLFRLDELFWKVTHNNGFGIRCIAVYNEGVQQAVELESGQQQRSLRRVFTFRVDGWVPCTPYTVNTVLRLDIEITSPDGGSETITVADVSGSVPAGGGDPEATRALDGDFPVTQ